MVFSQTVCLSIFRCNMQFQLKRQQQIDCDLSLTRPFRPFRQRRPHSLPHTHHLPRTQACVDLYYRGWVGCTMQEVAFCTACKTCGRLIASGVRGVNPISAPNVAMYPEASRQDCYLYYLCLCLCLCLYLYYSLGDGNVTSNYHSTPLPHHIISTTTICKGLSFGPKCCHKITLGQLSSPPHLLLPYCL